MRRKLPEISVVRHQGYFVIDADLRDECIGEPCAAAFRNQTCARCPRALPVSVGKIQCRDRANELACGRTRKYLLIALVERLALAGQAEHEVRCRRQIALGAGEDAMRGRVSAVNQVFIGASNELGGLESGVTAALLGPVISVVGGGIGTIVVVIWTAVKWPQVRRFGSLHDAGATTS